MTFRKYKSIDLAIYALILCVCEAVCVLAVKKWFEGQLFTVSVTCTVVAIVMMRWGAYSAIHAALGGFVLVFAHSLTGGIEVAPFQYIIYLVGNSFSLLMLLLFKFVPKEKIRDSWILTAVYAIGIYALMQFGKSVISMFFGGGLDAFKIFFFDDIISLLFTVVVVLIVRNLEGMLVDQKKYLLELEKEKNKEDDYNGR